MINSSILFVISDSDIGGASKMMKYLVNISSEMFNKVTLIETMADNRRNGISPKVTCFPLNIRYNGYFYFRLKIIFKIRKLLMQEMPSIMLTFVSHECMLSKIASVGLDCIVCSAEREDPYSYKFPWNIIYKIIYRKSDYSFFQLPKAREYYFSKTTDYSRTFIIPNVFVNNNEKGIYTGMRAKTIVAAGRFVPDKKFDTLINAFSIIHSKYQEYRLIIYGDGVCLKDYINLVNKLNLTGFVDFPGKVDSIIDAFYKEGIFVLSSQFEGIPNTMIEALSIGIPCVATDCSPGGPRYLSDNGKNALLVKVGDVKALSNAIEQFIINPQMAKEYGNRGSQILSDLSDSKIKKLWYNAFCQILSYSNENN